MDETAVPGRTWLPRLAPQPVMLGVTLALLTLVALASWWVTERPWLGLTLAPEGKVGVRVTAVAPDGPAAGRVTRDGTYGRGGRCRSSA